MINIDLSGKIALVTASSKGIGKGIAKTLSVAGAEVIIVSRNLERLKTVSQEIKRISENEVHVVQADLTSFDDLDHLLNVIKTDFKGVDIFVFNTGGPKPGSFKELEMSDWEEAVKLLLYPAVYLTYALVDYMMEKRWGRIIYSTSIAIKEPVVGLTLSNTVRIAMAGLIRSLAKEYASYGVTVNGIMPGYIETERIREIAIKRAEESNMSLEKILEDMSMNIPAKRMGKPDEIGFLAVFLSSEYASYINGAIIPVDGGLLNSSL